MQSNTELKKIGRYEVKSKIGRGGMATVYKAYDPRFKRDVAVKVLPADLLSDPKLRARFEREAQTVATLEHRAIVPVYDFGEQDGQPFLVMRYMPHGTLADLIKQGPLTIAEAATHLRRLGAALDHVHSNGVVHRDIKPTNIMFDEYGEAYLADFGIVRVPEATAANLTGTGIIGTPAYMSPEQVRGERDIDKRSDIYALGVILFEMLTGKLPYESETPVGLAMMHVTEPLPDIRKTMPSLPGGSQKIINRAMAKTRDERYSSALALASAVTDLANAAAQGIGAQTVMETEPPPAATVVEHQFQPPPTVAGSQVYAPVTPPTAPAATAPVAPPYVEERRRSPAVWIVGLIIVLVLGGGLAVIVGWFGVSTLFGDVQEPTVAPAAETPTLPPETESTAPEPEVEAPGGAPTVSLIAPTVGAEVTLPLGAGPLVVQFLAQAPTGVARVDMKVNGTLVDARAAEEGATALATQFEWMPPTVGVYLVSVETVALDGAVSEPMFFTLTVVEPVAEPAATATDTPEPTETPEVTPTATASGSGGGSAAGERAVEGTYTSSATNVNPGQSVTLSWDLESNDDFIFSLELWEFPENASQPIKHSIVSSIKEHSGSLTFSPTSTTTYRLDAYFNDEDEQPTVQQREITVTVGGSGASVSPSATPSGSGGGSGGGTGGPISIRGVSFVSATRLNDAGDAEIIQSVEFAGGSGPFTIGGDGVLPGQTLNVTGTFASGGVTYSFIHFRMSGKCGGGFPATIILTDSDGQTASQPYFSDPIACN